MTPLLHAQRAQPVITGFGVVGPTGTGVDQFWEAIRCGRSAIRAITLFDATPYASRIAGEADPVAASPWLTDSGLKFNRCARHTQMALVAFEEALERAGLPRGEGRFDSAHVVMGGGIGAFDIVHDSSIQLQTSYGGRANPTLVTAAAPQATAASIAEVLGDVGQVTTISTACASGLDAIGQAAALIRRGEAELVIAGGADSPLSPVPFANLVAAGLASTQNDDPGSASRPFDRRSDSGVISEGACVVILESHSHAVSRGAEPYAEVVGYANQIDLPGADAGEGFVKSMQAAILNAGCRATDVDCVSAWGPSHPVMDRTETRAIKKALGKRSYEIPVSSIKGVVGNPFSAAGPMQVAAASLGMREGLVPPTANHEEPAPECDLDYVPMEARSKQVDRTLLNAHGVGGGNCSLLLQRICL